MPLNVRGGTGQPTRDPTVFGQLNLIAAGGNLQLATAVSKRSARYDATLIPRTLIENNLFARAYSKSILSLAEYLYESIQKQDQILLKGINKDKIYRPIALKILASSDCEVLVSIMEGNLPQKARLDPRMRQLMNSYNNSSKERAGIYIQYIVSKNDHRGLSPRELDGVVKGIRNYFTDNDYALKVDRTIRSARARKSWLSEERHKFPKARRYAGYHKKEPFQYHNYTVLKRRQERTLEFADNLERLINSIPQSEWDKPMEKPLTEIGWSKNCYKRLMQHLGHTASNHIMCLVHAIAVKEFPLRQFHLDQHVVYYISGPEQGALAEAIFTHLAHPWVSDATGFTHHPPGLNNDSVMDIKTRAWIDAATVLKYSPFEHNIKAMMEPFIRYKAETRRIQEETARIEAATEEAAKHRDERVKQGAKQVIGMRLQAQYKQMVADRLGKIQAAVLKFLPSPIGKHGKGKGGKKGAPGPA
jgi:hypothetical protein